MSNPYEKIEQHYNEALALVHDDYFEGHMQHTEEEAFELGFSAGLKAAKLYPEELKD